MRRIDSWIGLPLVRALGWFTPKSRSLYGDTHPERVSERVICAKFIGLGSVVLSLPLLKALKESGARVAFWSFPGQAELVRLSGYADEVWVISPKLKEFVPSLLKSWMAARRFKAQAFLDLEPTANFSALLARTVGAAIRVGFMSAKPLREALFTHLVALTSERHMVENNLCMGRLIGLSADVATELPAPPNATGSGPHQDGKLRIVLNVNASDLSWHRMWPESHWVELCGKLLKEPSVELILPGAPSERERVQSLVDKLEAAYGARGRISNIAGKTSLLQLMQIIRASSLVVSVDSGIMHMAAWMGVPLVAMFGPETPRLYGPRSSAARVLSAALPCSPCLSVAADKITRCSDNQCMKAITPARVLLACQSLLSAYSRPKPEAEPLPAKPGPAEAA